MQSYLMIGEVLKPQGIRGEVKIRTCFSDPEAFLGWDTLYVKRGDGYAPIRCAGNRLRDGFAYAVLDGAVYGFDPTWDNTDLYDAEGNEYLAHD